MFVKKFQSRSMEGALALVKEAFGSNALILSTEKKTEGIIPRDCFVVTAAVDRSPKRDHGMDEGTLNRVFPHRQQLSNVGSIRKTRLSRYIDLRSSSTDPSTLELSWLRLGISIEGAKELNRKILYEYPHEYLANPSSLENAKRQVLISKVRCSDLSLFCEDPPKRWLFVGSAGSGKTSLVVKLAIELKKKGQTVFIQASENRKVTAAVEMSAYSELIGIAVPGQNQKGHLLLVDGPTLSLATADSFLASGKFSGMKTILVIDANIRATVGRRIFQLVRALHPVGIALTKVDLVEDRGACWELVKELGLPLVASSQSHSFKDGLKFFDPKGFASFVLDSGAT